MSKKQKKPFYKKWWVWIIAIIVIFAWASGGEDTEETASEPDESEAVEENEANEAEETNANNEQEDIEESGQNEETEENAPEEVSQEKEPDTLEEYVESIVDEVVGLEVGDEERIVALEIEDAEQGGKFVYLNMIGDESLTLNTTKSGLWMDSLEIFEPIFERDEVSEVSVMWQLELTDQYGNSEYDMVMSTTFTKETAEKVNWENVLYENVPNIADSYYEHPALNN